MAQPYSLVDIFSGPGGISTGLEMSGHFQSVAAIEMNHAAATTYGTNFPHSHVFETDVSKVSSKQILKQAKARGFKKIDAICGGPPCRPFSKANTGKTRWKMVKKIKKISMHPDWENFIRFVRELKPKFVIAENVMGFRTNHDVFSYFVDSLEHLGYTVITPLLDASKFGVPQTRNRIIIIAVNGKFDKKLLVPKPIGDVYTVGDAIADLPEITNEFPTNEKNSYTTNRLSQYAKKLRRNNNQLYNHKTHSVNEIMKTRFLYIDQGYNLKKAWEEKKIPKHVLKARYIQAGRVRTYTIKSLEKIHSNIYRRLQWNAPSPTLTHPRKTVIIHPFQHRILSVRECARIQSFPDRFIFIGSMNQQYQQIADAAPPFLIKQIGTTLVNLASVPQNKAMEIELVSR